MKLLLVLLSAFLTALVTIKISGHGYNIALAGRIAMAAFLLLTAYGHFAYIKGMEMMIPSFIPFKREMVLITGVLEAMAAIGLLIPRFSQLTGWFLIIFLIMIFPANIHAALRHVSFQNASYEGPGPSYLWFRIPMQLFLILWAYLSAVNDTGN